MVGGGGGGGGDGDGGEAGLLRWIGEVIILVELTLRL